MYGVVQFLRSLLYVALMLGAAGTLVEATGIVGREAAKAHQHGGGLQILKSQTEWDQMIDELIQKDQLQKNSPTINQFAKSQKNTVLVFYFTGV